GDELTVDHAAGRHPARGRHDLGDVDRDVVQAAVLQAHLAGRVAHQHAAQAVPLDLEQVLGRAERRLGRRGLHRPHLVGEAVQLDLKLVGFRPRPRHSPRLGRAPRGGIGYEALRRLCLVSAAGFSFSRPERCFFACSTDWRSASMRSMTLAGWGASGASMTSPSILAWTTFMTASLYSSL